MMAGLNRTYGGDVARGERNVSLVNMVKLAAAAVKLSRILKVVERELGKQMTLFLNLLLLW